jgi:hypothetical protein
VGAGAGEPWPSHTRTAVPPAESATDVGLDGDEMAADADDGDANDSTETYILSE